MKLYYAHSMRIYGTQLEAQDLEIIRRAFPLDEIVNPATIPYDGSGMLMYYRLVRDSDVVVFSTYEEHVGRGVWEEVRTARQEHKPVFLIDRLRNRLGLWSGSFSLMNCGDWKIYYARPVSA